MFGYSSSDSTTVQILNEINAHKHNRAHLPNNAVEVYETDDVVYNDATPHKPVTSSNPDITSERIQPKLIFERFVNEIHYKPQHPLNDNINNKNTYNDRLKLSQYSDNTNELAEHRLSRLRDEISDFSYELNLLKSNQSINNTGAVDEVVKQIEHELQVLQGQLNVAQHKSDAGNINDELNHLGSRTSIQQLQYNDSTVKPLITTLRIPAIEIEKRVSSLEKRIGVSNLIDIQSSSQPNIQFDNVTSALNYITQHLSLLDTNQINQIKQQCRIVSADIQLTEQQHKSTQQSSNKLSTQQIDQLDKTYRLLCNYELVCNTIPHLAYRLKQLHTLHNVAANAMNRLEAIETRVSAMRDRRENDMNAVNALSESLTKTVESMRVNFQQLDNRINNLTSKQ